MPGNPERSVRSRFIRSRAGKSIAAIICAGGLLLTPTVGAIAAPFAPSGVNGQVAAAQDASGQYIADFALGFQGYPYVWAGNTPGGFDCSGFTQYVILNTVGIDIGHGTAGQMNYGAWVDWGAWEPGDLIYFAGTWDAGISHTGVYIGDGMFIHAENEMTGVTISSLYSDYYAGHYYGAIRVG
jgi:cell wall-associated NlpC family hydrolase